MLLYTCARILKEMSDAEKSERNLKTDGVDFGKKKKCRKIFLATWSNCANYCWFTLILRNFLYMLMCVWHITHMGQGNRCSSYLFLIPTDMLLLWSKEVTSHTWALIPFLLVPSAFAKASADAVCLVPCALYHVPYFTTFSLSQWWTNKVQGLMLFFSLSA